MARSHAFSLLCLASLGCQPETVANPADAGDNAASAAIQKACADNAYARCSRLEACSPIAIQYRFGDTPTCESLYKAFCVGNLSAPSTGASATTAEACATAIPNWACGDYLFTQNLPPECGNAMGQLPMAAPCAFPSQCQSAFCAIPPGAACGQCAPPPKPGDSCANLTTCGAPLNCDPTSMTCVPFGAMGAPCGPTAHCASGLGCAGANAQQSGTCQPNGQALGAPCSPGGAGCDFNSGLVCNTLTAQCARIQLAKGGQSCGQVAFQTAFCEAQGQCVGETTTPGVCVATAALGGACDIAQGPGCVTPARCIVGTDGGSGGTCQIEAASQCR